MSSSIYPSDHGKLPWREDEIRQLRERNAKLVAALNEIAKKRKLDAVAAASMQAIARTAVVDDLVNQPLTEKP